MSEVATPVTFLWLLSTCLRERYVIIGVKSRKTVMTDRSMGSFTRNLKPNH